MCDTIVDVYTLYTLLCSMNYIIYNDVYHSSDMSKAGQVGQISRKIFL